MPMFPAMRSRSRSTAAFSNSGNVVPVGSQNHYVTDSTVFNDGGRGGARRDNSHENLLPQNFDGTGYSRR